MANLMVELGTVKAKLVKSRPTKGSNLEQWDITENIKDAGYNPAKLKNLKLTLRMLRLDPDTLQADLLIEFEE